jgi:hypothetical protein
VLDHPGDLAVDDDREDDDAVVLAARLLEHVLGREPAPPALDLRIGAELDDPGTSASASGRRRTRSPRNSMTVL